MSYIGSSRGSYRTQPTRSYISMAAYQNDFFSYTTSQNPRTFEITGALGPVSGATAGNCPQGRFLYENGKKLLPGVNPGVETYMVGVYDPVTFLSGYIDPNSQAFTVMSTDKSYQIQTFQGNNLVFGINPNGNTSDKAQPVYTNGNIIAEGDITTLGNLIVSGSATVDGNLQTNTNLEVAGSSHVYGDSLVDGYLTTNKLGLAGTPISVNLAGGNVNIDCSLGSFFSANVTSATSINAINVSQGQIVYIVFYNGTGGNITVVLGNQIRELFASGSPQSLDTVAGLQAVMQFIGFGGSPNYLLEVSRTINSTG